MLSIIPSTARETRMNRRRLAPLYERSHLLQFFFNPVRSVLSLSLSELKASFPNSSSVRVKGILPPPLGASIFLLGAKFSRSRPPYLLARAASSSNPFACPSKSPLIHPQIRCSNASPNLSSGAPAAPPKPQIELEFVGPKADADGSYPVDRAVAGSGEKLLRDVMLDNKIKIYAPYGKVMNKHRESVPKEETRVMEACLSDKLTRENVASHLEDNLF